MRHGIRMAIREDIENDERDEQKNEEAGSRVRLDCFPHAGFLRSRFVPESGRYAVRGSVCPESAASECIPSRRTITIPNSDPVLTHELRTGFQPAGDRTKMKSSWTSSFPNFRS